jgi:hypothetical protein
MVSWREREARNEARFRDQNEWIEATNGSFGWNSRMEFVCECGDEYCTQTVNLSREEYESVRTAANRFLVVTNHENPEAEQVVSEGPRFAVIEKIEGWGLRVARETDPRSTNEPKAGQ